MPEFTQPEELVDPEHEPGLLQSVLFVPVQSPEFAQLVVLFPPQLFLLSHAFSLI